MKRPKQILVALKEYEHAVELTDLASRVGTRGATLLLVHVIELPDVTPLDAELPELEALAKKILRAGERMARRSRLKTKTLVLRAHSAGAALLDELKERKIDLAILGYHHGRLGEAVFGSTARHVAAQAPCRVLLSIPRLR